MNSNGHKCILVVDDEETIRDLLKRNFKLFKPDYQVIIAADSGIALKELQQRTFDLVVTDYQMPGLNGLELAGEIRRLSPTTRIVLMTGGSLLQRNGPVELENLDGYVEKPFTSTQIFGVIEALIGQ